jgi:biopolymer transport protein ExbB
MMAAIRDFMDTGGQVLTVISVVIFALWLLIIERLFFTFLTYRRYEKNLLDTWFNRSERESWNAVQIRQAYIARAKEKLNDNLPLINTMVALCPMLGLLGTVTGMIQVFDAMAVTGSGNARSMASGVSRATIPTMAGMVGALSGVFAVTWLQRNAKKRAQLLEDHLPLDH